jgi:hypothetical protein
VIVRWDNYEGGKGRKRQMKCGVGRRKRREEM